MSVDQMRATLEQFDALAEYIEDFGRLSGGEMHRKYGDDPMDGYDCALRRVRAYRRKVQRVLSRRAAGGPEVG